VGCRYATVDPAAIGALFAVIRAADPQATPLFQQPDMRAVIHLAREDGARVDFFLQDNLGSKLPVIGVVETSSAGTLRSVPLTAGPTLMTDLRDWATRHGGVGDGSGCRPH
jgi:ribosomal protein S12 methylthiotransferase accessory factor YcaO